MFSFQAASARPPVLLAPAKHPQPAFLTNIPYFPFKQPQQGQQYCLPWLSVNNLPLAQQGSQYCSLWQGINNLPQAWQGSQILLALARHQQPATGLARLSNFARSSKFEEQEQPVLVLQTTLFLVLAKPPATAPRAAQSAPSSREIPAGPPQQGPRFTRRRNISLLPWQA